MRIFNVGEIVNFLSLGKLLLGKLLFGKFLLGKLLLGKLLLGKLTIGEVGSLGGYCCGNCIWESCVKEST